MIKFSDLEIDIIINIANEITSSNFTRANKKSILISNIKNRILSLKLSSLQQYLLYINKNPTEVKELLTSLTINTTYWFREKKHYPIFKNELKRIAQEAPKNLDSLSKSKFKITVLSVGCSSGQEVYTLAMILESFSKEFPIDYRITGLDIDPRQIGIAKRAIYLKSDLDRIPKEYHRHLKFGRGELDPYFTFSEEIRKRCFFVHGDLTKIESYFKGHFNFVFCRNVLIYFDTKIIDNFVKSAYKLLDSQGLLFLGHSEFFSDKKVLLKGIGNSVFRKESQENFQKHSLKKESTEINEIIPPSHTSVNLDKLKILTIDDSKSVQQIYHSHFNEYPVDLKQASSAFEADQILSSFQPDIITLDLIMPKVSGLEWLNKFRAKDAKTPVIIISSTNKREIETTVEALYEKAQDFICKDRFFDKPKAYCKAITEIADQKKDNKSRNFLLKEFKQKRRYSADLILIGSSTGGPQALSELLYNLPSDFPPVVVVQHMVSDFNHPFAKRLSTVSKLKCNFQYPDDLKPSHLYIANGDFHLKLAKNSMLQIEKSNQPARFGHRPSVDVLFSSATHLCASKNIVAVLLTGMGHDGARALKRLSDAGAYTIAQDQESSVVFGMPRAALNYGGVHFCGNIGLIRKKLIELSSSSLKKVA